MNWNGPMNLGEASSEELDAMISALQKRVHDVLKLLDAEYGCGGLTVNAMPIVLAVIARNVHMPREKLLDMVGVAYDSFTQDNPRAGPLPPPKPAPNELCQCGHLHADHMRTQSAEHPMCCAAVVAFSASTGFAATCSCRAYQPSRDNEGLLMLKRARREP